MKNFLQLLLLVCGLCPLISNAQSDGLPRGAYDLPYKRYESEAATKGGSAMLKSSPQYNMSEIASEASDQKYVSLPNGGSITWSMTNAGAGFNMRFTLPDAGSTGQNGSLDLYVNNAFVKTINLTSYWAWQYFNKYEHDPSNIGPKEFTFMRFDEVHFRLATKLNSGDVVRIQNSGSLEIGVDFIEIEEVPVALPKPSGYISVVDKGAIPNDGIDDQAAFNAAVAEADAANTGVYIPEGQFTLANCWRVSASNMGIKGAGMWYTNVHYSTNAFFSGGLMSSSTALDISDIYFSTNNNIRWENGQYRVYKGMMGSYGDGTKMQRLWIEHFECGMWIGDYDNTPLQHTTNLLVSHCRIRNNYADGINFCQGTSNSIVEFCSIRNEGDDGIASWAAKDMGNTVNCANLIFRNNTIENNWRAGSIGIFGGKNHQIHHNLIKDGVAGSGIRFTTEFSGFLFEENTEMKIYENTIISCGTSTDLVDQEKGAIELYSAQGPITNLTFSNNNIINAQRDGVIIGAGTINNVTFNNLTINGTGLDGQTKSAFAAPYNGGYAVFCFAGSGTTTFNNLVMSNINGQSATPIYKGNAGYNLIVNSAPPVPVTGVTVSPTSTTLAAGATRQLTPTVSPSNATNKSVTYTSSNNAVATVSAAGLITAIASGSATITVKTVDQSKTATCAVTVSNVPVTGITVNPTTATIATGSTQQLTPTVSPSNATNKNVTYSTNNSSVATVNNSGLISAIAPGSAIITVTTVDGGKTTTCAVTVSNVAVTGISVSPTSATIGVGSTQQITPTISPGNATNKNVTYSTSNSVVATVNSSGLITAVTVGTATITATTVDGAKTATCAVTVTSNSIAPWVSADVGSTALAGSATQSGGTFTVKGSGADAWGAADAFQFVYQAVTGDMTITARIATIQNTNTYAKVGIDVRNSLTADSKHAMNVLHANGAMDYQYRTSDGSSTSSAGSVNVTAPYWVRIQRVGNILTGYRSANGTTWTQSGTTTITLNSTVFVGLMVCSHDNTLLNTSTFSNVTLTSANVAVTGVTVSPTSASINVGATRQLTATVAPANATNKNVTWSTSNASVATVNSSGLVTAVAQGNATITVTTQDGGKTATSAITVTTGSVAVTGVTVSPASASINIGATQQLTATVAPANATNKNVTWSTSNGSVATVNSSGLVTAVSSGSATITVTTVDGGKTATSAITVNSTSQSAYPGGTPWAIPGTIEFENYDNGGEGVAYHDNEAANQGGQYRTSEGVDVEACSEGGYNIGWTGTGEWYEYTVNVASSGTYNIDVRTASTFAGGTFHIEFNGVDKTGLFTTTNTGAWQTWTTISKTGISLTAGVQVMRVYLNNANFNLNKITFTGTSGNVAVTGVTVSPTTTSLSAGGIQQLTATVAPANATNKSVTWSSNNTGVATVNASGLVTAVATGSATITVTTVDGNKTATCAVTVTGGGTTSYRIKNRWQNTYLYDGGDRVRYSTTPSGNTYNWVVEDVGSGQKELRNVGTNEYMHIENLTGYVQCTARTSGWMSSRWTTEDAGSGYIRLKNVWQPSYYQHVENLLGYDQYGTINSSWWSAQWILEPSGAREAVEEVTAEGVSVWPTVVETELHIQSDGSYQAVQVIDMLGRIHHQDNNIEGKHAITMDVSSLASGLHFVKLRNATQSKTFRIVKK